MGNIVGATILLLLFCIFGVAVFLLMHPELGQLLLVAFCLLIALGIAIRIASPAFRRKKDVAARPHETFGREPMYREEYRGR